MSISRPTRRWPARVAALVAAALAGASLVWAYGQVFDSDSGLPSASYTLATAKPGKVGSSILLNTVADWPSHGLGINRAAGVVTSVPFRSGAAVTTGKVLYTVDLRPVVIAAGAVPAFRALSLSDEGPDVKQLQTMLSKQGFFTGTPDGEFDTETLYAVIAWQKVLGIDPNGVVDLGDIIFVPADFPLRVTLDSSMLQAGATLVGGESVVAELPKAPRFVMPVTDTQAAVMPTGTRVIISGPKSRRWIAVVDSQTLDAENQQIELTLRSMSSRPICRDSCGAIPVTGNTRLSSKVVTLPTVRGLTIPVAAISSGQDGLHVIDKSGKTVSVTVLGSADGVAVVEGLEEGQVVRIGPQS